VFGSHELEKNKVPMVGLFIAGKLGGKQDILLWTVIMEYLTNPLINKRISMKGNRTGILIHVDEGTKATMTSYLFEIPQSARWNISTTIEMVNKFPTEHQFTTREVIMEEEK
jgi:hypothetical protein